MTTAAHWMILFTEAVAVVSGTGGILSHASVTGLE